MKYLLSTSLLLISMLLSAQPESNQILKKHRVFEFADVERELSDLRKATVEHIVVRGDNTPAGDQQMLETLRKFLAPRISNTNKTDSWKKLSREVKRLNIENANWAQLPAELGEFDRLSELTFVNCPSLDLQAVNNQVKALDKRSHLYEKFHDEMISMTFQDVRWQVDGGFALDSNLFSDLRELRFINIGNFQECCPSLLPALQHACPTLGWLTLAGCELDDRLPLDTLRAFPKLQALSLQANRLSHVPALPPRLVSLDLSFNLISEFIEKTPDNPLRMLYMDCNLFNGLTMKDLYARDLYPNLEVLTFECNNLVDTVLESTTRTLDQRRVASFMSYAPRYVNDFKPEKTECGYCLDYRWKVAKSLLEGVPFSGLAGGTAQLVFGKNGDKIRLDRAAGGSTTYEFVQFTKAERNAARDWVFTIEVSDALNLKGLEKYLIVTRSGNPSISAGTLEVVE